MSKKIYINPGHSNVDPGAVGYETERTLNVKVSAYMNEHLLANYDCQTMVTDGNNNSLTAVANEANKWGANLFVSPHFNAGVGDGFEALVYSENRVPLGQVFEKYVKAAGQNSRGVKIRPGLAVLRLTNMPAIICEGAFVDNRKDIEDWNDDEELKKLGIAYAKAAAEYLNSEKKATSPAPADPEADSTLYRVQVGAFKVKANAEALRKKLRAMGFTDAFIKSAVDTSGTIYRVQVGAFRDKANAEAMLAKVKAAGFTDAYICC